MVAGRQRRLRHAAVRFAAMLPGPAVGFARSVGQRAAVESVPTVVPTALGVPRDHLAVGASHIGGRLKPGRLFTYAHDGIGNRDWTFAGSAAGMTEYGTNDKNQLSSVTNPGVAHVSGYAAATSRVEVGYAGSTRAAHRDGAYWYAAVPVANANSAVVAVITVTITNPDGAYTVRTITRLVHKASESLGGGLGVDLRGSRTSDSVWDYEWDDFDRLQSVTIKTALRASYNVRVEFAYDFFGRRIGKTVKEWDSQAGQWVTAEEGVTKFIWSGWLLLAETNEENKITRSYVWGRDLSGSVGGAGGIGGLLAVQHHNTTTGVVEHTYWVGADERGDTQRLVEADGSQPKVVAAFEYGPHGEVLAVDAAPGVNLDISNPTSLCPFLHSTKYFDAETGLYYFGYRYMDPATGTWISRDPIGEQGGLNLYAYCMNDPVGTTDPYGLSLIIPPFDSGQIGWVYKGTGVDPAGLPQSYVGSTIDLPGRGLETTRHAYHSVFSDPNTTIEAWRVYGEPNAELTPQHTPRAALNRALRAAEQPVIDFARAEMAARGREFRGHDTYLGE